MRRDLSDLAFLKTLMIDGNTAFNGGARKTTLTTFTDLARSCRVKSGLVTEFALRICRCPQPKDPEARME